MNIQFTKEELIDAINQIDNNPEVKTNRHSSTYDLIFKNNKYPPILVLSLANEAKNGKALKLSDFGNNTEIPFKILRENGFEIIPKTPTNLKEQFSLFLKRRNKDGSQKASSYLRSIDLLDKILNSKAKGELNGFHSIYEIESTKKINALYQFVINEQNKENGIFRNETPTSYWKKRFYSAALKSYKDFLNQNSKLGISQYKLNDIDSKSFEVAFNIENFYHCCEISGLNYTPQLITRFIASLLTKPFLILTGLSGSGKTKLAQAFVQWISQDRSQYRIIPVGADWTNREPLLGYPNALDPEDYVKPDNGVIDLMNTAHSNPELPYFLILDEMNLSHVERYFADFLSVMESNEEIPLHDGDEEKNGVPPRLGLPSNLFIIGTVNIDETTNMFSPKVLDRANTIEFRIDNTEMKDFLGSMKELNMEALEYKGANMAEDFVQLSKDKSVTSKDTVEIVEILLKFFGELRKTGAEFGYRTASEIMRLIHQLHVLDDSITTNNKIDIAIMQKLLPKLHGSRRKLSPILETLGSFCLPNNKNIIKEVFEKEDFNFKDNNEVYYPLSLEKISRMYKGAIDNGFTSFAEA